MADADFRTRPGIRHHNETRRDELWSLARKQHGVITLDQALACGRSRNAVARLVANGTLRRAFPRTYLLAAMPPSLEQRAMAAVLWAKAPAVISHDTAAALWGLLPATGPIHITAARTLSSPPSGIRCHTSSLPRRDCGRLRRIPVTTVARTLLDLAGTRSVDDLHVAVEAAVLTNMVSPDRLHDVVAHNRGRRGCRRLASVLEAEVREGRWTSALERRVESILVGADLPAFVREHPVGPYRVDFAWPPQRVALEADGRRWHSSADDFARDRAKHNHLTAAGWRVLRVTWADAETPERVRNALGRLLRDSA